MIVTPLPELPPALGSTRTLCATIPLEIVREVSSSIPATGVFGSAGGNASGAFSVVESAHATRLALAGSCMWKVTSCRRVQCPKAGDGQMGEGSPRAVGVVSACAAR